MSGLLNGHTEAVLNRLTQLEEGQGRLFEKVEDLTEAVHSLSVAVKALEVRMCTAPNTCLDLCRRVSSLETWADVSRARHENTAEWKAELRGALQGMAATWGVIGGIVSALITAGIVFAIKHFGRH